MATSPEFSRAPAAPFKPRINLRVPDRGAWEEFRRSGATIVIRCGALPDGSEVSLGRTVDTNLSESRVAYWRHLFGAGFCAWVPSCLRWVMVRWYPVEVKGYEMTPLPPKES